MNYKIPRSATCRCRKSKSRRIKKGSIENDHPLLSYTRACKIKPPQQECHSCPVTFCHRCLLYSIRDPPVLILFLPYLLIFSFGLRDEKWGTKVRVRVRFDFALDGSGCMDRGYAHSLQSACVISASSHPLYSHLQ